MNSYSRTHLADRALLTQTRDRVTHQCEDTAELLADLAEVDQRRLHLTEGYDSMLRFCLGEYGFSEDMAYKRIQVARAARQYPAIFHAVAAGRINLSAARLLVPHLTPENVDELLAAATRKTNAEIQVLLARRESGTAGGGSELAVRQVGSLELQRVTGQTECPGEPAAASATTARRPKRMDLRRRTAPQCYEKWRSAGELLGHGVPSGEMGEVFERAIEALIEKLERKRFAATSRMGTRRSRGLGRYVPAEVRRAVVNRDGGQCTYVSESGHRCGSRMRLEFDHVTPVAQGGRSSVDGIRLLCRAHNQLAAERAFGIGFMQTKRKAARARSVESRRREGPEGEVRAAFAGQGADLATAAGHAAVKSWATTGSMDMESEKTRDVIAGLRALGFNSMRARLGAASCSTIPDASLEDQLRHALRTLAPRCERTPASQPRDASLPG